MNAISYLSAVEQGWVNHVILHSHHGIDIVLYTPDQPFRIYIISMHGNRLAATLCEFFTTHTAAGIVVQMGCHPVSDLDQTKPSGLDSNDWFQTLSRYRRSKSEYWCTRQYKTPTRIPITSTVLTRMDVASFLKLLCTCREILLSASSWSLLSMVHPGWLDRTFSPEDFCITIQTKRNFLLGFQNKKLHYRCINIKGEPQIFGSFPSIRPRPLFPLAVVSPLDSAP